MMPTTVLRSNSFLYPWSIGLISIILLIVVLYEINIQMGIKNFSNTISLPIYTVIPGSLVILSIWAIVRAETIEELPKKALIFLSLSFILWFLAEQTWNLYEHVLMIDPYPSVADVFYVSAPVSMLIALSIFLRSTGKKISKKNIAIASIFAIIILIPSIVGTLEAGSEYEPLEILIAMTYPIVDAILLIPVIITILFLIKNKKSFFWGMILAGIVIMLTADTIFLFAVINEDYEDGHPVDILWVTSYTIWSFMMFFLIWESKNKKEETEIYKKFGSKKIQKYGIFVGLILINLTVVFLLIGINYFTNFNLEDPTLAFFSWMIVMILIIFSSILIMLNSQLNKTLQSRTSQLERKSAELINSERFSAIGELASRVSHDIRNPLSNIKMSIELMKNSSPETKISDNTISEKLELAQKNIDRISHQVNDVLRFVKDIKLTKQKSMVSRILLETIESIQIPSNIKIKIPKSKVLILADSFQIQIVFNNILINAVQAIGKERGEIFIRIIEKQYDVIIEFENSGPKIPEHIFNHIFDSLVTTKQIGTGLGLASCKTIVENHTGTIKVRNDPVTFTVSLPKE